MELCEPFNVVTIQLMAIVSKLNVEKNDKSTRSALENDLTRAEFYLIQTQNYRDFLLKDLNSNYKAYTVEGCKQSLRKDERYFESYVLEFNHLL